MLRHHIYTQATEISWERLCTSAFASTYHNICNSSSGSQSWNLHKSTQSTTRSCHSTVATPNHGTSHLIRLVPHLDTRRSLRFDAISRDLKEGDPSSHIGRFSDRSGLRLAANALGSNKLAFKSKVVLVHTLRYGSRVVEGSLDTKSSSGTFLHHDRLGIANSESRPFQRHPTARSGLSRRSRGYLQNC